MDFWFLFWSAYPGAAAAAAVFAGRALNRMSKLKPGDSAICGVGLGLVWPIGLLWVIITGLNHRDRLAADRRKAEVMDLHTAHKVIARHEAQLAADRQVRNRRLHEDWEKLARLASPPVKGGPAWQRKITDFNN
jgi:hypothetical protein